MDIHATPLQDEMVVKTWVLIPPPKITEKSITKYLSTKIVPSAWRLIVLAFVLAILLSN